MARVINRTQFLRGDFRGTRIPLRPPWSVEENTFVSLCTRCDDCIRVCPQNILLRAQGGFPAVDFLRGECTFCHACADACQTGALAWHADTLPWRVTPEIGEECLARRGIFCLTCTEQCMRGAIKLRQQAGRAAQPYIETAACNGCGACYRPCPAAAIRISTSPISDEKNAIAQEVRI